MANIVYNWPDMEKNLMESAVGYLHGEKTKFNKYKERHPERVWIVRQRDHVLYLLGYLVVCEDGPKNIKVKLKENFIFYDAKKSVLFKNIESIQDKLGDSLDTACKSMRAGNYQGINGADQIEYHQSMRLERAVGDEPTMTLEEATFLLKEAGCLWDVFSSNNRSARSKVIRDDYQSDSTPSTDPIVDSETDSSTLSPQDFDLRWKKQMQNGLAGEVIAKNYEINRLRLLGCEDPESHVEHVSLYNVSAGYDIRSMWKGEIRCIEVKTSETTSSSFFISANEVETLTRLKSEGWIYFVNLSASEGAVDRVRAFNDVGEKLAMDDVLKPIQFSCSTKNFI